MPNYDYVDENGEFANRVVKYGDKQFRQEHYDEEGNLVKGRGNADYPYHLDEVLEGIDQGHPIWIFEGEGDVETARLNGLVATTNSGGAGKWNDKHSKWCIAAEPVFICFDNDDQGRRHALKVEASLRRVGVQEIHFRKAKIGKDFTDHISAGLEVSELIKVRRPKIKNGDVKEEENGVYLDKPQSAAFQLALQRLKKVMPEYGKPNQYNAICPAHNDTRPSLSIRPGEDVAVLVTCHANGCDPKDIARALDIDPVEFTAVPVAALDEQEKLNQQALMRRRAQRHADQVLAREGLSNIKKFGSLDKTGTDELAIPLEPIKWTIDQWFRYGTSVQLISDPKAGKSRIALNLMRSLVEGEPFLGIYQTSWPEGARIWYGNWDMPEDLFREYLHDYQWTNSNDFIVEHLAAGEFPFWIEEVFDDFVQYALRMNIQMMIVDTMHISSQGFVTNEWSNTEMSEYISLLKKLCKAAKIPHLLIIHHTGKADKETGRGASSQGGDVDGIWTLTLDGDDFDSPRTLKAKGRKVGVAPVQLGYDVATESYSVDLGTRVVGYGDRAKSKVDADVARRVDYMRALIRFRDEHDGQWPKVREAMNLIRGKTKLKTERMKECEELGLVRRTRTDQGAFLSVSPAGVSFLTREGE